LAKNGVRNLALTDLSREKLLATAEEIKAQYPHVEIEAMQLDVCDEKAVDNTMLQAVKRFVRIDVGINFAGVAGAGKATAECEETDWMKVNDVNLNGVWRSQRAQLRAMLQQEYVIRSHYRLY
jgi:NADP-dependent 3-hydroxy acid dehydrogenase YdfG